MTYFDDTFDNGIPPPDAPNLATGGAISYSLQGTVGPESGGKLTLDLDNGVLGSGISETGSNLSLRARLLTNTNQANLTDGLKSDDTFAVTGIFDLVVPNENGTRFGIRLTDASGGAEGDDIVELVLDRRADGVLVIQLRDLDDIANTNIILEEALLQPGHGQIALRLESPSLSNNTS